MARWVFSVQPNLQEQDCDDAAMMDHGNRLAKTHKLILFWERIVVVIRMLFGRSADRPRQYWLLCCTGIVFCCLFLSGRPCLGITINLIHRAEGDTVTTYGIAEDAPITAAGNGTLPQVMEAAASFWESAFADPFTLTIEYGWFPRTGGTTATHRLLTEGGNPHRETSAAIVFDSDGSTPWFRDPTPAYANEFSSLIELTEDLGGGEMTTGLRIVGGQGIAGRRDLLTTALHEIGHALGLSSANDALALEGVDGDVDVMSPLPFVGAEIPLNGAHLDLPEAVMKSSRPNATRRLLSEADILANAQTSQFTQVNLQPSIPTTTTMDFDGDGLVNIVDLNLLLAEGPVAAGVLVDELFNGLFDLNADGTIDNADRDFWLAEAAVVNGLASPYLVGDANLDGFVNGQDFVLWNENKFGNATDWDLGDFTGDGVVDGVDFVAWNGNKFLASDELTAVPEPGSSLLATGLLFIVVGRRRCCG